MPTSYIIIMQSCIGSQLFCTLGCKCIAHFDYITASFRFGRASYIYTHVYTCIHVLMKMRRKKEASNVKQTTRQSNTAHPRQSHFLRKIICLGWDSNPRHSRQSALPTELPRQLSWLGPNLTSHSTPDEQAYYLQHLSQYALREPCN